MKRIKNEEYKRIKQLKQKIGNIPEKETNIPLLKSSLSRPIFGYDLDGFDAMTMMNIMLIRAMFNRRP